MDSTFRMRHRQEPMGSWHRLITRTLAAIDSCLIFTTIHRCNRAARQEPGSDLNQSRIWEKDPPLSSPPFRSECFPITGWFSNRTETSVDDGARKSSTWLDQWQIDKLGTGSGVWSFSRAFLSSNDAPVLLLNQKVWMRVPTTQVPNFSSYCVEGRPCLPKYWLKDYIFPTVKSALLFLSYIVLWFSWPWGGRVVGVGRD